MAISTRFAGQIADASPRFTNKVLAHNVSAYVLSHMLNFIAKHYD